MYSLKELVGRERHVVFQYYRDRALWYVVEGTEFSFPVPIEDIGNATFLHRDRALLFMRYIKPHLELIKSAQEG